MVKNGPNSLRNATSNRPIRESAYDQMPPSQSDGNDQRNTEATYQSQGASRIQPSSAFANLNPTLYGNVSPISAPSPRFESSAYPLSGSSLGTNARDMKDSAWRPHNGSTFPPQTSREFQHELDLTRQTRNDASQRSAHNSASSTGVKAALWHISYDGNIKRGDPPRWTSIEHEAGVPTLLAPHPSLYQQYNGFKQELQLTPRPDECSTPRENVLKTPEAYTKPFCDFLTENPTVWHAVDYFEKKLEKAGFSKLSERKIWTSELQPGGKYFVTRNGSSMVAFTVGKNYKSGNGVAMIAGHVDALTARLKPVSTKKTTAGYVQLGVAPYGGGLNTTWWDRDLSIGGRVLVKDSKTGKITTRLVKLGWPIAKIPTLAPHFGVGMEGQQNKETQTVPIIGLDYSSDIYDHAPEEFVNLTLGGEGTFISTQPPKLVRAIAGELSIENSSSIVNWELELYDCQPAQLGGLDKEFIFAGRIDDKLCSWAAMEGLLASASSPAEDDSIVKLVAVFDDEEIGSLLRQGARGNFLSSTVERVSEAFSSNGSSANILSQTYANSFLVSADVTHAVHPNFLASYLEGHAPRLNVGLVVSADSNGHMTTDSVSTALLTRVAEKTNNKLQLFMIRNDSRGGGTVGPMLSSAMGVRGIDAGLPQLSMHSIRATTGSLDPGLGVSIFKGFLDNFESVDKEFE